MRPLFQAELVNGDTGDPALFVDFLFTNRAFLFDLGELSQLSPKKILRIHAVFVSHAHMDHFIGFDRLLRIFLGREKKLVLFGPPGFIGQVAAKLSAYTWNLVENYSANLLLMVNELHPDGKCEKASFASRRKFIPDLLEPSMIHDGVLVDEPFYRIRFAFLDHAIPCLAFCMEEKCHANIWKNRLEELGLVTGPWLRKFREAVLKHDPDDTLILAGDREMKLGELWSAVRIVPGQKISYVTDAVYSEANIERIVALADCSDILFIEAMFLMEDGEHAVEKHHLTAWQAGKLGKLARVKTIVPFHFSPRYSGRELLLRREVQAAFSP